MTDKQQTNTGDAQHYAYNTEGCISTEQKGASAKLAMLEWDLLQFITVEEAKELSLPLWKCQRWKLHGHKIAVIKDRGEVQPTYIREMRPTPRLLFDFLCTLPTLIGEFGPLDGKDYYPEGMRSLEPLARWLCVNDWKYKPTQDTLEHWYGTNIHQTVSRLARVNALIPDHEWEDKVGAKRPRADTTPQDSWDTRPRVAPQPWEYKYTHYRPNSDPDMAVCKNPLSLLSKEVRSTLISQLYAGGECVMSSGVVMERENEGFEMTYANKRYRINKNVECNWSDEWKVIVVPILLPNTPGCGRDGVYNILAIPPVYSDRVGTGRTDRALEDVPIGGDESEVVHNRVLLGH